ncbi:MAG TPA: DUF6538 domain-containing protein, partial [Lichenihabitans sp.]|nr:DUF6538 domain-containing protein [Lichenihabitans sp.]
MAYLVFSDGCMTVTTKYVFPKPGGSLYYRRRKPRDLSDRLGTVDHVESLRTKDPVAAATRAARKTAELDAYWESLRNPEASFTPKETQAAARARLKALRLEPAAAARNPDGWWRIIEAQEDEHGHDYMEARHHGREDVADSTLTPLNKEVQRLFEHGEGPKLVTMSDAKTLYFEHHTKGDDSRFVRDNSRAYDALLSMAGDLPLQAYTRAHATALRDKLRAQQTPAGKPLSTATVRRRWNTLVAMFNKGKREHGLNIGNPFEKIDIPREGADAKKRPTFTKEQLLTIAAACRKLDDERRHILAIQLDTGARLKEIVGL